MAKYTGEVLGFMAILTELRISAEDISTPIILHYSEFLIVKGYKYCALLSPFISFSV